MKIKVQATQLQRSIIMIEAGDKYIPFYGDEAEEEKLRVFTFEFTQEDVLKVGKPIKELVGAEKTAFLMPKQGKKKAKDKKPIEIKL